VEGSVESHGKKTLGQAIDEIVAAVEALDESARMTALKAACEHLGFAGIAPGSPARVESHVKEAPVHAGFTPQAPVSSVHDIRSLKDEKQPGSALEMACVVAYFLESLAAPGDRKAEVGVPDLEKYFKQGGYPLRKRMAQVLVDARGAGYFDSAGRGKYKLNPVGHNLVVHKLPKREPKQ
jgi:hypothetical protein